MTPPRAFSLRSVRVLLVAVAALVAFAIPVAPAQGSDIAGRPADGVFTFDGRGFGHGRGMSQYGAYGAALRGLTSAQILAFYYSGSTLGTVPGAQRRVLLTGEDADLAVTNAAGLRLRDSATGAVVETGPRPDWASVRVRPEGPAMVAEALQGGTWVRVLGPVSGPVLLEGPPTIALQHPAGLRTYRGTLTAALSGQASKPLYVVNTTGLDDYVRGVVPAEMPSGWHEQALRAQAVAARSYGMQPCPQASAYPAITLYDVVDTTACQVYGGVGSEAARTNDAVAATTGQVLRQNGVVLRTEFSASNGGWTVASGSAPAKPDPYDVVGAQAAGQQDAVHRWTGKRVPATALEAAFGTGVLREVRVLQRDGFGEWGGRVLRVRLVGDSRTVDVTGAAVRAAAGLRSTWFDLVSPIDVKHAALGGNAGLLGGAVGPEAQLAGGTYRPYQRGLIYFSPPQGAFEVHGSILDRYGRLGWENGALSFPVTDERTAPDGRGRYNHFVRGSIYWSPTTGAWSVLGPIRARWEASGWELGVLGYPVSDQTVTPNGRGSFNHFQGGSIYWSPATGAHDVRGIIRLKWAENRWEAGPLGFPVSDEYTVPGGRRSDFENGSIVWDRATGQARVL
jgi:SpoIID/LytB domain protein